MGALEKKRRGRIGWLAFIACIALSLTSGARTYAQDTGDEGEAETEAAPEEAPSEPQRPTLVPPRLLEAPPLMLPEGAEDLPEGAAVELLLTISPDGSVREVQIDRPLRDDVDALVLEVAQQMRFEPATRDGVPIPARIRFRYRLSLPTPEPTVPPEEPTGDTGSGDTDSRTPGPATTEPATGPTQGADGTSGDETSDPEIDVSSMETEGLQILGVQAIVERPEVGAATRVTLQAEELTTVPGTMGEPLRVVATLPGVVRSPFGLGFFLVRGAAFANTGFLVDGFPIPLLYHFGAGPAVISSRLVSRLHFYPGGYPSQYGRFSAGIVSLETAAPPTQSARGELEVDLFRASVLASVPFDDGRGTVVGAFRRSYYDLLLPLVQPGLDIAYTDYQLRVDYRVDSHVSFSLFGFGSDDTLDQRGAFGDGVASEGTQTVFGYNFQRLIGTLRFRLPHDVKLSIAGMMGLDAQFFENSVPGSAPLRFELGNTYAGLRVHSEIPFTREIQTNVGVDINTTVFQVHASAFVPAGLGEYPRPLFTPQSSPIDRNVVQALAAFYVDQILRLGDVELSASARFDYMRYGDVAEVFPDPRAVVRWQVVPELLLKAATGLFTQPPTAFQLTPEANSLDLPPQRSWQSSMGGELTLPERVEVHATAYYSQMFDIARQVNRVIMTDDGPQRRFFVADQEGRAYGMELMIRRRVEEGLYGWLSYTLSRSERRTADGQWVPFDFDQTHVLNLAVSYAYHGWRFGAAFQVATGRVTNSLVGAVYDSDEDGFDPRFRRLGARLSTFNRLDLRIDRNFSIGPITGSVYLDVQNVYNSPNTEGTLYSYDYSQTSALPGLPILPALGVRGVIQ